MALIALLFAHHGVGPAGEPSAALRVAGVTVIKRQVGQARRFGASRVLIVVERMPPGLATALDRTDVEIVRVSTGFSVEDDDKVLVIADSLVVDQRSVAAVLGREAPALAVWKGRGGYDGAERIDPSTHWAGIALYPGELVANTLAGLGEWDLQATLLRAVHSDGRPARVDLGTLDAAGSALVWRPVRDADEAYGATRFQLAASDVGHRDWPSRFIYKAIEEPLLSLLIEKTISPALLMSGAIVSGLGATLSFAVGWLWVGLFFAIISGFLVGLGGRLARATDAIVGVPRWVGLAIEGSWYVGLAVSFIDGHEIAAPWALAALVLSGIWGNVSVRRAYRTISSHSLDDAGTIEGRLRLFGGHRNALLWSLLPFAAINAWWAGFAWVAAYSMGTFLWSQARMFARLRPL